MINYDEFKKVEIKIGKILSVEKMENADKLLILKVDFGFKEIEKIVPASDAKVDDNMVEQKAEEVLKTTERVADIRQIVSGIFPYFPEPEKLVGIHCAFVANLEPRKIKGYDSNGMILAVGGDGEPFSLFKMGDEIEPGATAR
jgi:methionyl-tRNA synthetase